MSYSMASSTEVVVPGRIVDVEPIDYNSQPSMKKVRNTKGKKKTYKRKTRSYMASSDKIMEMLALKKEASQSFMPCQSSISGQYVVQYVVRSLCFTPPWTALLFFLSIPACVGIAFFETLGACGFCVPKIDVPPITIHEKPVAVIRPDGVVADTYYELNDEVDSSVSTLITWNNILSVSVRKPREKLRPCGTTICDTNESDNFDGISFKCDVKAGLFVPCCSIICQEKGINDYSEVIFYSSRSGRNRSSELINQDPSLQEKAKRYKDAEKEFFVGTDISKVKIMGLLQVDQFIADLQQEAPQHRGGVPLPIHENKIHIIYNPDNQSDGYSGSDGTGMGGKIIFFFRYFV